MKSKRNISWEEYSKNNDTRTNNSFQRNMSESSSTGLGINADLNDIYIGNIKASEDMENKILVFLEDALKDEPLISVNSQNKTFTISLDSYFEDLSFYSLIKQIMHAETSFDVLSEHDCININISLNN